MEPYLWHRSLTSSRSQPNMLRSGCKTKIARNREEQTSSLHALSSLFFFLAWIFYALSGSRAPLLLPTELTALLVLSLSRLQFTDVSLAFAVELYAAHTYMHTGRLLASMVAEPQSLPCLQICGVQRSQRDQKIQYNCTQRRIPRPLPTEKLH